MATHNTLTSLFSDIADSIRAKTGENRVLVADDFPDEIDAIQTGGGAAGYTITYNLTNCTKAADSPTMLYEGNLAEIHLVPNAGYAIMNILVSGATIKSLDTINGSCIIENPTGNISITGAAIERKYFWFENISESNVTLQGDREADWKKINPLYSYDKNTWNTVFDENGQLKTITIEPHQKLYYCAYQGKATGGNVGCYVHLSNRNATKVGGDIFCLMNGVGYFDGTPLYDRMFCNIMANTRPVDVSELVLPYIPSEKLTNISYLYSEIFASYCTTLVNASFTLPAITSGSYMFSDMFRGCTSLTYPPLFQESTRGYCCFYHMFYGCTSLTTPPVLPATTLANSCYWEMFYGCTSLTAAPALPATTLTNSCYSGMFKGCTSLVTAPTLPATTLTSYCYQSMFSDCTALTTAPALSATSLQSTYSCCQSMFSGCTALITVPALPATKLGNGCYHYMFQNCTSLKVYSEPGDGHDKAWTIPSNGVFAYAYQGFAVNMFDGVQKDSGVPVSPNFPAGTSVTYYTEFEPISANGGTDE